MKKANLRLQIHFDFALHAPDALLNLDHADLCKKIATLLGPAVAQGMPTVSAKQLDRAQIALLEHHHHLDVTHLVPAAIPVEQVVAAAPHLTDDEAAGVARRAGSKAPTDPEALLRHLRRLAMETASEYRLVRCTARGLLTSGAAGEVHGDLNLTNGHIFPAEAHKSTRLAAGQPPLSVRVEGTPVVLPATLSGQTLTGPVLDVAVADLVPHRTALLARWQASQTSSAT
ncbi:MAG: hypothetical protein JNM61_10515 [Zoogloeaceae bacterium]|nr:hypothetical protein [Zoogloeaceae bacterium]